MTSEQELYIISHWDEMSCESLRKMFNEEFGTQYKTTGFHYHTKRLGLSKHVEHRYTPEQDAFLRENSDKMTRKELAEAFNAKFGACVKEQAIEQRCFLRGWRPKTDGRFKVGGTPWCKTKGGRSEYVKTLKGGNVTSFKKGIVPHNALKVGTVKRYGHLVQVKTADGWKNRLRHMWELEHGKIPEGYVVTSVDGDQLTEDARNLRLISNKTLTTLMSNGWCGKGSLIVDTGIVWCELKDALSKSDARQFLRVYNKGRRANALEDKII